MHEVLVNHFGDLNLPRRSVVGLTDRPVMTLDVYQQYDNNNIRFDQEKTGLLGKPCHYINYTFAISPDKRISKETNIMFCIILYYMLNYGFVLL